jgi:hypothetical protein
MSKASTRVLVDLPDPDVPVAEGSLLLPCACSLIGADNSQGPGS